MFYDHVVKERLRAIAKDRTAMCQSCPQKGEGLGQISFDGKIHSGSFLASWTASMRVKVSCLACNGQMVKPEKGLASYTECSRFKRAERIAERLKDREVQHNVPLSASVTR